MNIMALACLVGKATSSAYEDTETHLPSVKSLRGLIGRSLHLNPVVLALIYVSNESCLLSRFLPLLTANTKAKSLDF